MLKEKYLNIHALNRVSLHYGHSLTDRDVYELRIDDVPVGDASIFTDGKLKVGVYSVSLADLDLISKELEEALKTEVAAE